MLTSRNLLTDKGKYLFGAVVLFCILALCAAFGSTDNDDFALARREVLLRKIGHEVLLHSGDKTSRVLPIEKIAANRYRISFGKELNFESDFLVNTTKRLLAKDPISSDYVVNVRNCGKPEITFGYALSKNTKNDIVACSGRKQPKACYVIEITFMPTETNSVKNGYLLGSLPLLALIGFVFFRASKPQKIASESTNPDVMTLGSMSFDPTARKLITNSEAIDLTSTETRILRIFANSPNEIIERSRLQTEIWEDEKGVIVSRSLDVFISKLRKKLELDPKVKIVVVRAKGYRLEIAR
ncbi:winged helix-turn-helix domain-containing protein [Flavobacterium sp.]|uniref:winged helix-turn-helix domain-containing protein n=1 Tax=Flavobacterium sp. TaxID=239 RepID=UPI00120BC5D9|nr:winged helix-turn-helix domain-containing protein [Flavobacterium sp.]RZJ73042.1 MAG: winged helix family transcriptional regulator [Flavobacterium sp.]